MRLLGKGELFAGRYEIVEHLGAGGMGIVYRALDQKLKRDVAIKTLAFERGEGRRSSARREWQRRFEHEALSLAQLEHPNIIGVHDYGEDNELAFLVMSYFAGRELDNWWDEQKPSVKQGIGVAKMILRALEHAHRREVLHRDLKSSNILVGGSAANPELRVIDWGLSLAGDHSRLTDAGALVGTQGYMDPEIIADPTKDHDPRSDLYALGALLYWLWCERDHIELEEGWTDTRRYDAYAKNIVRAPHEHNPALAGDLETVILKLLATRRAERPCSAAETIELLERVEANEPVDFASIRRKHEKPTKAERTAQPLKQDDAVAILDAVQQALADSAIKAPSERPLAEPLPESIKAQLPAELVRFPSALKQANVEKSKPAAQIPDSRFDFRNAGARTRRPWIAWAGGLAALLLIAIGLGFAKSAPPPPRPEEPIPAPVTAQDLDSARPAEKPALEQMIQPETPADDYDAKIAARYGKREQIGKPFGPSKVKPTTQETEQKPQPLKPPTVTTAVFRPSEPMADRKEADKGGLRIPNNAEADGKLLEFIDTSSDTNVRVELKKALRTGDETVLPAGTLVIGRASLKNARALVRFERAVLNDGTTMNVSAIAIGTDRREGLVGRFEYGDKPDSDNAGLVAEAAGEVALDVAGALLPGADGASKTTKRAVGREVDNGRHRRAETVRRPDRITVARGTMVRIVFNATAY